MPVSDSFYTLQVSTSVAEAKQSCKDPLRLTGIRDSTGALDIFAHSDREPVFITKDPIDAIILFIATIYIFQLAFKNSVSSNKFAVLFLCACAMSPVKVSRYIGRNDKFLDLCRKFGLHI